MTKTIIAALALAALTGTASAQQRTIYDSRGILSNMSRDWSKWTAADWQPLENELKELSP